MVSLNRIATRVFGSIPFVNVRLVNALSRKTDNASRIKNVTKQE